MEKILNKLKERFSSHDLMRGRNGIEREVLRTDKNGELSLKNHPEVFGDKIKNPYITTDFAESQIELITPAFEDVKETYNFANALYDITAMEIGDELLWPQSMPCIVDDDKNIRIASYEDHEHGRTARNYREKLLRKYGAKKQLISGIHYNFSFADDFIKTLYNEEDLYSLFLEDKVEFKEFKNSIYLKTARNYLRYRWLLIYLLGATTVFHNTYICKCEKCLKNIDRESFLSEESISFRNSECGYKNKIDLFPNYDSVDEYIRSIESFINDELIENHKELYSPIRLKSRNPEEFKNSLINDGIEYLEFRSVDINPFEKGGISLEDLEFLKVFNLFALIWDESSYDMWQQEALYNQNKIGKHGQKNVLLKKDGADISREDYSMEILENMKYISRKLNLNKEEIIDNMIEKVKDVKNTYAYKLKEMSKKYGYVDFNLKLAEEYKEKAYNNRFKFTGYEDMELSTQILMKEAVKRGIKVQIVDRSENFIKLSKDDKTEYVKQATKTSKDNYVTVLIMENKSVTKTVLREHNINVPDGIEVNSMEEALSNIRAFEMKPIVVKPKSTNFGTGISIFKDGACFEDIKKALEIAFRHDNTVLIERFIKGKEYRFLVMNHKVCGILHRVPANVTGDGEKSIRELVKIKNNDSLRGYHYVTPLEKIILDENAELFLKGQNKDFDYVPENNEIVYLRENSNISTGGDSIDYTDDIGDRFKDIAVKCAEAVDAKICGVDMMIEDYSDENSDYGIIELNFNPAIHIHCYPYKGKERKIAVEVLKVLEFI